jgi:hypothetical protein
VKGKFAKLKHNLKKMSSGAGKIMCVTGASGFLASWIIKFLLQCRLRGIQDIGILGLVLGLDSRK